MPGAKPTVQLLIGTALLIALVMLVHVYIGWGELLRPWASLSPSALLSATALVMFSYLLRAVRLYDYFRADMAHPGAFALAFKLMLQHNLLNNFLPMRSGEISFPVLMARYFDVPISRSVPALLWFRILDLHALCLIALFAVGSLWLDTVPLVLAIAIWVTLPWWLFIFHTRLADYLQHRVSGRVGNIAVKALNALPQSHQAFFRSYGWTLVNWLIKLAAFAGVLMMFIETDIDAAAALLGAISGELTSVLPIHGVAGAGTYEAGVVAGLALSTTPPALALAAAVNLHLFLLGVCVIGGVLSLFLGTRHGVR